MLHKFFITAFFLSTFSLLFAQNEALKVIDTVDLKRHLSFISSDSLQGRTWGTPIPGLDIAAEYLKANIKKTGLADGATDYFQEVPIVSSQPDIENSFLEITDTKGKVIFKTDSIIGLTDVSGINISNAEIVFAGFGYNDEQSGYDDFHGLELQGKVVMFSTGTPKEYQKNESPRWNNTLETGKIKRAMEAGSAGVIIVDSPLDKGISIYNRIDRWRNRGSYNLETSENNRDRINFVLTTASQADVILGGDGKFKFLLSGISKNNHPNSNSVEGLRINLRATRKTEQVSAKNVIGIVEGSDPVLKNECIVFMAHYDHLGIDKDGDVYNGADDNGSGTVTLLEVAEAFNSLKQKPKRSIVFLWVTAEEVGELGSQYYVDNPVFPMEKTVACINIDMDGRVFEQRDTIWNQSPKKVKDFDGLYTLTNDVWPGLKEINSNACKKLGLIPDYSLPANFLRSSDHYSFHIKGVPILNYATGYHADYHKVTDEVSRINFDKIKRVADLCFLVGLEIANQDKIERTNK